MAVGALVVICLLYLSSPAILARVRTTPSGSGSGQLERDDRHPRTQVMSKSPSNGWIPVQTECRHECSTPWATRPERSSGCTPVLADSRRRNSSDECPGACSEGGRPSVTVLTAGRRQEPETIVGPHGESVVFVMGPERSGSGILRILDLMRFAVGVTPEGSPSPRGCCRVGRATRCRECRLRWRRRRAFLFFSDSWSAATKDATSLLARVGNRPIGLLENSTLKRADLVVAVTRELRSMASDAGSQRVMLVEKTGSRRTISARWARDGVVPTSSDKPFFLYAAVAASSTGSGLRFRGQSPVG